jgi:hypothetical protein
MARKFKAEAATFPRLSTGKGVRKTKAEKLIEQLRDHLQNQTSEQIERTSHKKRNVVIRIDRRSRRSRSQTQGNTMQYYQDSISKVTQCCHPMSTLDRRVASYDTRSTDSTSVSLEQIESSSFFQSHDESYRVFDIVTSSSDSTSQRQEEHQKALLRLKADILSIDSTSVGDGGSTTDDGASTCDEFTDREAFADESYSVTTRDSSRFQQHGCEGIEARDDNEEDGNDNVKFMKNPETRDTIEETNIHGNKSYQPQRIFIVRSEHSIEDEEGSAMLTDASSHPNATSVKTETSADATVSSRKVPPALLPPSGSDSSRLLRSGVNSHDERWLEQVEIGEKHTSVVNKKEANVTATEAELGHESLSLPLDPADAAPEGSHQDKEIISQMKVLADIGKALEEASLDVSLRLSSSLNKQSNLSGSERGLIAHDHIDSEPVLVSSGTLSWHPSIMSESDGIGVSIQTLYKIPFVHGSFAAAAPFVMHDLKWKRILRKLMPEAHAKAVAQMEKTNCVESLRVTQMMKWAENNPVVAAYGILSNNYANISVPEPEMNAMPTPMASNKFRPVQQFKRPTVPMTPLTKSRIPPLEWNVFLDPLIVAQLDTAIDNQRRNLSAEADFEVHQHTLRLVKRMILTHGSTSQLLAEALGLHRAFTFASIVQEVDFVQSDKQQSKERVLKRPIRPSGGNFTKSCGTAMFATKWLATLAAALYLGGQLKSNPTATVQMDGDQDFGAILADSSDEMLQNLQPVCGLALCLGFSDKNSTGTDASENSFGESAKCIAKILGEPLRIVLNLRSRRVPGQVWARLVDYMRDNDVLIESVASFDVDELREIGSSVTAPVKQFRIFHSAGDLQKACHAGEVREGEHIFFNAASLIETDQDPMNALLCGLDEYNDEIVFSEYALPKSALPAHRRKYKASIEDYKTKFSLNIGCYVQEFSVSPHTMDCLVGFFNLYSATYNLGLAYGGVNGRVVSGGIDGDGFARQRFMGTQWDPDAKPLYNMQPLAPWHSKSIQKTLLAGSWGPLGTVNDGEPDTKPKFKW